MKHIRISLIGAGMISAKHLAAYQEIPEAQVVAVCSRTQQSAARCAEEWNIPDFCTDVQAMLARDDIDAVDICVHNNLHAPYAIAALRAGTHVYCEKPLAGSYADGLAMVEAARETGKTLHIQLGTLYETATRAAKRLVDGGALGELYHARTVGFRRRNRPFVDGYGSADFAQKQYAGGGALYDFGVNHIALLLYLMGLPTPTRMSGRLYQKIAMDEQRRLESRYDVEEPSVGFVRFDNGATMDLFESWAAHLDSMDPSVLLGSKGGFKLDPFSFHTTSATRSWTAPAIWRAWNPLAPHPALKYAYTSSEKHWIAALLGQVPLLPTAEPALRTMLIQESIVLSSKLGREVTAEAAAAASVSTALKVQRNIFDSAKQQLRGAVRVWGEIRRPAQCRLLRKRAAYRRWASWIRWRHPTAAPAACRCPDWPPAPTCPPELQNPGVFHRRKTPGRNGAGRRRRL